MRGAWHVVGGSVLALPVGLVSYSASAQCTTSVVGFGAGEAGESAYVFDLGQSATPALDTEVVQISGGIFHTAAVLADGTVVCWGSNAFGSPSGLGRVFGTDANGAPIASGTIGQRVQHFGVTLTGIAEVRGGEMHTVARRIDGSVIAWGGNEFGQLNVPAGLVATKIDAGSLHTLALTPSGGVVCWGACAGVPKAAASGMADLAAGYEHSLAWNAAGTLLAWGRNDYGQSTVPAELPATKQAAGGIYSTLALGVDGVVRAWGGNQGGQCGGSNADGSIDSSDGTHLRVVRILGQPLDNVVAVSSGGGYHGMALRADGTVVAWGAGPVFNWAQGQTVVPPATAGRAVAIDAGYMHSYIQTTTSTIDCDANGTVDCVELALIEGADADEDGALDACQAIDVPGDYKTIQAAIDAIPAGIARTILVAAGTYNQSFSLNGKNVVVRGAPGNATIVDGTGLTTSVARFAGGEPTTAGVENLVIRNGTVGSLIFPGASFRVGGGLYAANSSAYVKNCRFESNRSNFGGGAYIYRSSTSIDGCQFVSNIASSEGGGLQLFESSGPIANSSFTGNSAGPAGAGAASAFKVVGARTAGGVVLVSNCTVQSSIGGADTAAVEMFEIAGSGGTEGILRLSNTLISGNSASTGAGGLRVVGTQRSCVLTGGTSICSNSPRNVLGPFLIEGSATVCDCLADLTLDGAVNGADLGAVLAAWGAASANGVGDANHDGFVNGADLAQVLAAWGACQ
jgi:alpha-tubulin suppressor-like RCC1 family protein